MPVFVCGDNASVFDCEILWRDPVAKQHLTGATVPAVQVHRGREVIKRSAAPGVVYQNKRRIFVAIASV